VAGSSAGTVSIGAFEVSRWRDGRGDLPMGIQSAPAGLCGCLHRGGWTNRAAQIVVSAEVEAWTAVAKTSREGRSRIQSAHRRSVQEHNGVEGGEGRTEYSRQLPGPLGKRNLIEQIETPKGLDEEKPQSRTTALDSSWRQLQVAKQMHLVLADMAWAKALRRAVEVLRKILYRVDVATDCAWGVVATLEQADAHLCDVLSPLCLGLHSPIVNVSGKTLQRA
jgi:hypothetical protein